MAVWPITSPARHPRIHDHTRPLDITITALEASHCPWCRGLLTLLKQHLEEIAFRGLEVLN